MIQTKICPHCGMNKTLDQFSRHATKKNPEARHCWCKSCVHLKEAERRKLTPHENKERCMAWRLANPEKHRASSEPSRIRWVSDNKDRVNAISRAWRESNREQCNESRRVYYARNLEIERQRGRIHANSRRAQQNGSRGTYTKYDIEILYAKQKGRCAYCKENLNHRFHTDHRIALARGGNNDIFNIQLTCAHCNQMKHARDPIDFAQSIGLLL
jgi:hypothetical protein